MTPVTSELTAGFVTPLFGFLAIMNPLANAPVFLGLTGDLEPKAQRAVAVRGVLTAFIVVAGFGVAGDEILKAFGVSIPAVRAFGGLIVAHVGFQLLSKAQSTAHTPSGGASSDGLGVAISPLAIPILAGPGTLATTLGFTAGTGWERKLLTLSAFAVVSMLTLFAFLAAGKLVKRLGEELIDAMTKVMGMILGAIGVEMLISGVMALSRGK